jgi:hypothetical protein
MSLVLASVVMGLDGALYCVMGACMLYPSSILGRFDLARLYPSIFKTFLTCHQQSGYDEADPEPPARPVVAVVRPLAELVHELAFRLLAYLLIMVGVSRLITGLHWGCGFIYLALCTCLAEIAMVCNELLREDSILLHGAMAVFLCNMALSLVYLSAGLPYCTA